LQFDSTVAILLNRLAFKPYSLAASSKQKANTNKGWNIKRIANALFPKVLHCSSPFWKNQLLFEPFSMIIKLSIQKTDKHN
jgi:hypothetical protein